MGRREPPLSNGTIMDTGFGGGWVFFPPITGGDEMEWSEAMPERTYLCGRTHPNNPTSVLGLIIFAREITY